MSSVNDTEDIASSVIICNAVLIPLSTISIAVRFYTRFCVTKSYGWDDLCIGIGYFFAMGLAVTTLIETRYGLGRHVATLSPEDLAMFLKYNFFAQMTYIPSFVASKLSFVFFYLKIFPSTGYRYACYVIGAALVAEFIEETAVVMAQCKPFAKAWKPELPGNCIELLTFYYVAFATKLVTDLALFCLPIPMLRKLSIGLAKKVGVMFMFSLGLLACVTSIVRATYLSDSHPDLTFILTPQLNWSTIELCSLVICACVPSFRAFLRLSPILSRLLDLRSHSSMIKTEQQSSSYRLESRSKWARSDAFANSRNIPTISGPSDNESQVEILEGDGVEGKSGITVTRSVMIDHNNDEDSLQAKE